VVVSQCVWTAAYAAIASLCCSEPVCLDSGLERIIFYTSCLEHIDTSITCL
jgi:hypothetical protein